MLPLIVGSIIDIVGKIFDKVIPDKSAADKARVEFMLMAQSAEFNLALEQIKTNSIEAANTNWFVAGWRPAIGWICGIALGYTYIILPFMQFFVYAYGNAAMAAQLKMLPVLDLGQLMPILLGMLGLGAMRTWEKIAGAEGKR